MLTQSVVPAQAASVDCSSASWIPAYAGKTKDEVIVALLTHSVVPAQAGIHRLQLGPLDSRSRGNDEE